jgi:hypothetical protein
MNPKEPSFLFLFYVFLKSLIAYGFKTLRILIFGIIPHQILPDKQTWVKTTFNFLMNFSSYLMLKNTNLSNYFS